MVKNGFLGSKYVSHHKRILRQASRYVENAVSLRPLFNELFNDFIRLATTTRVIWLMLASILFVGNRTVANLLRLLSFFGRFNPSTFHRVLSHRRWSSVSLSKIIIRFILQRYAPTGIVRLCGDETIDGHRGKKVYDKARHRDAVRSSHSHTVFR